MRWFLCALAMLAIPAASQVSTTIALVVTPASGYELTWLNANKIDETEPASENQYFTDETAYWIDNEQDFTSTWADSIVIKTANAHRTCTVSCDRTHSVNVGAQVAVAHHQGITTKPSWLTTNFTKTNDTIQLFTDDIFDLWVADYADGNFTTSANTTDGSGTYPNYFVIVRHGAFRVPANTAGGAGEANFLTGSDSVNEETAAYSAPVVTRSDTSGAASIDVVDAGTGTATATTFASLLGAAAFTTGATTPADLTWAAGTNRAAWVLVSYDGATNLTAMTYRGQSMTLLSSDSQGDDKSYFFAINDATADAGSGNSFSPTWSSGAPTSTEFVSLAGLVQNANQTLANWDTFAANYGAAAANFNESVNADTIGSFGLAFAYESDVAAVEGTWGDGYTLQATDVASDNLLSWATKQLMSGGDPSSYARGTDREAGVMTLIAVPTVTEGGYAFPSTSFSWVDGNNDNKLWDVDIGTVGANQTAIFDLANASGVTEGSTNQFTLTIVNAGAPPAETISPRSCLGSLWWGVNQLNIDDVCVGQVSPQVNQVMDEEGTREESGSADYLTLNNLFDDIMAANDWGTVQLSGQKGSQLQEDFWYCSTTTAPFEEGGWVGAYWQTDGITAWRDIQTLIVEFIEQLSTAEQAKVLGIRYSNLAIRAEPWQPTSACRAGSAFSAGSRTSGGAPTNWDASVGRQQICDNIEWHLDTMFPSGDSNPSRSGIRPYYRPQTINDFCEPVSDTTAITRLDSMWGDGRIGFHMTSGRDDAHNANILAGLQKIKEHSRDTGTNNYCIHEGWGDYPASRNNWPTGARFSNLQQNYYYMLQTLHIGCRWLGFRDEELALDTTETEWANTFDFFVLYGGGTSGNYHQNPTDSPGAWVVFRGGVVWDTNYDLLATQNTDNSCVDGADLYAGFTGPGTPAAAISTDYVGEPSDTTSNNTTAGTGDRRSLYAKQFANGECANIDLTAAFSADIDDAAQDVYVHYLNTNASTTINCTVFGVAQSGISVTADNTWSIQKFDIAAGDTTSNDDIYCTASGGEMVLHRIEIRRDGEGGLW